MMTTNAGIRVEFGRNPDGPASGRQMCLVCSQTFLLLSAVPVARVCGEILGFICPDCLDPSARALFDATCQRFNDNGDDANTQPA